MTKKRQKELKTKIRFIGYNALSRNLTPEEKMEIDKIRKELDESVLGKE